MMKRWTGSAVSEAALLLVLAIIGSAQAAEPQCTFPNEIIGMGHPLHRTSRPISTGGPLTIVALGSTAGAGASKPEVSYPSRLREHLSSLLGHRMIVVNRGRNGDRVGDMLFRLPTEVIPEHPDAVIWQLGTNALLTDLDRKDFSSLFSLRGAGNHRHGSRLDRHGSAIRTQGLSASAGNGFRPPNRRRGPSGRRGTFPQILSLCGFGTTSISASNNSCRRTNCT